LWPFGVTLLPTGAKTITKRKIASHKKTSDRDKAYLGVCIRLWIRGSSSASPADVQEPRRIVYSVETKKKCISQ
jgi:hypothetical protein